MSEWIWERMMERVLFYNTIFSILSCPARIWIYKCFRFVFNLLYIVSINAFFLITLNVKREEYTSLRLCRPTGVVDSGTDYAEGTGLKSWIRHGCKTDYPFILGGNGGRLLGASIIKRSPLLALVVGQGLWLRPRHWKKKVCDCNRFQFYLWQQLHCYTITSFFFK